MSNREADVEMNKMANNGSGNNVVDAAAATSVDLQGHDATESALHGTFSSCLFQLPLPRLPSFHLTLCLAEDSSGNTKSKANNVAAATSNSRKRPDDLPLDIGAESRRCNKDDDTIR